MRTINILIVEDNDEDREGLLKAFADIQRSGIAVKAFPAATLREAKKVLKEQFLDVALVDIQLIPNTPNTHGIDVLQELKERRPSCWRIMHTVYADDRRTILQFAPEEATAHHVFVKQRHTHAQKAEAIIQKLSHPRMELENPTDVLKTLTQKREIFREVRVDPTEAEVQYLIATLFRPHTPPEDSNVLMLPSPKLRDDPESMEVGSIRLEPFSEGYSPTILFQGKPRASRGLDAKRSEMIWCAIKIGERRHIKTEYVRYNRYVRFNMSPVRRVELLGYAMADTLGALCYSFAGERPREALSLRTLLDLERDSALQCLNVLLNPAEEERFWYFVNETDRVAGDGGVKGRLAYGRFELAEEALSKLPEFARQIVEEIRKKEKAEVTFSPRPDFGNQDPMIQFDDRHGLLVPDLQVMAINKLQNPYHQCIVHGDLHGENILVSFDRVAGEIVGEAARFRVEDKEYCDAGRPHAVRIDFAHTGLGPISHEFAQLEGAVRASKSACTVPSLEVLKEQRIEGEVWRSVWGREIGDWENRNAGVGTWPYWARVAHEIGWLARKNFHQNGKEWLSATEYAATCLMTATQQLRWEMTGEESLTEAERERRRGEAGDENQERRNRRLRVMVWMSHLVQVLRE
jgi:CheY-like chemotaxis protein